ncbi:DNA cytosine methyltransferase [Adhaeribacter sp. BT258]|uniref:DNA (cytosine-5-)-methyltransferase n=1 Tax=Adhaeribacter terrigena TaxID=2793070 RepID=A0ABS1C252_9BACT|nr:DNA cytosine methyltransferase [Adhaeribacter terrigena]MBK0402723.1 DNA cytosine methyltransferase [Adhaeribacter terrigena]
MPTFYEFFAGGGMARSGLGNTWNCSFANDFDEMKGKAYKQNWGSEDLVIDDIANINATQLPGCADLAWASSPCQDLSLAGNGNGLGTPENENKTRSGTFWHFWSLMTKLSSENRSPKIVVLENVTGAITSNQGNDFAAIAGAFANLNYKFGAIVMDAQLFVPQSRKRLFVIGIREDITIPKELTTNYFNGLWHPDNLVASYKKLPVAIKQNWVWWHLPFPAKRKKNFIDIIEDEPLGVTWHSPEETQNLLDLMSPVNLAKVKNAMVSGKKTVGGIYRRTRKDKDGKSQQRAEVRFDQISGCLRTPGGGSSRQIILIVEGKQVKSRLLSPREGARLMGLPDNYQLPAKYNDAYHLVGDGVAVPVVHHLATNMFERVLAYNATGNNRRELEITEQIPYERAS